MTEMRKRIREERGIRSPKMRCNPRTDTVLCPIYPLDKERNADGGSRY